MRPWFVLVLLVLVVGCSDVSRNVEAPSPVATGAVPTASPVASPFLTPTPLAAPSLPSSQSPTSSPLVSLGPAPSQMTLSAWHFVDPEDPTLPEVLEITDAGFQLKADWTLQSAAYLSTWYGYGPYQVRSEQLVHTPQGYRRGDVEVGDAAITALLGSIQHLFRTQRVLGAVLHTDDYPYRFLELLGTDGQYLHISSRSAGNPGSGPWIVEVNGRAYVQYDGSLGKQINAVFEGRQTAETGDYGEFSVLFGSRGLAVHRSEYWGLVPLRDVFSYVADVQQQAILGRIWQRQISDATDWVKRVEMTGPGATTIPCPLTYNADDEVWTFRCPVPNARPGTSYRYPLSVTTGDDTTIMADHAVNGTSAGVLWRTWGTDDEIRFQPVPSDLATAMGQHPEVQHLLSDHVLIDARYGGRLDSRYPRGGTRSGDVILAGTRMVRGRAVRYTVGTEFAIEDGKVTYWTLTRDALSTALAQVLGLPLTERVLVHDPNAVINLWYGTNERHPRRSDGADPGEVTSIDVLPCGSVPGGHLPTDTQPFLGLSYNADWFVGDGPDVVLMDGMPIVAALSIDAADQDREQLFLDLLPNMDTGATRPFATIEIRGTTKDDATERTIGLFPSDDATADEEAVYDQVIHRIRPETPPGDRVLMHTSIQVEGDGSLRIVDCRAH